MSIVVDFLQPLPDDQCHRLAESNPAGCREWWRVHHCIRQKQFAQVANRYTLEPFSMIRYLEAVGVDDAFIAELIGLTHPDFHPSSWIIRHF